MITLRDSEAQNPLNVGLLGLRLIRENNVSGSTGRSWEKEVERRLIGNACGHWSAYRYLAMRT